MIEIYLQNLKEIIDLIYEYWGFFLFNLFVFVLSDILLKGVIRSWEIWKIHKFRTWIKKRK